MTRTAALFIGGMDSSGGAGLLRDAATAEAFGVSCRVAVTAVTAQSDGAVSAVHPVPPGTVAAQIDAAVEAGPRAVKIGMLCSGAIVRAVAGALRAALPAVPIVLDPVLCASSGRALLDPEGTTAMLEALLPQVALLTPNLPELRVLGAVFGLPGDAGDKAVVAALLRRAGGGAVLLKGGHLEGCGPCVDRLYLPDGTRLDFSSPRQPRHLRGTGCQLASAVAAGLALGEALPQAVRQAKAAVDARFAFPD